MAERFSNEMLPQGQPRRRLESGISIIEENIEENNQEITFEFKTDHASNMGDLAELWNPKSINCIIFNKLVERNWITKDGTVNVHFQMNVHADTKENKIKIRYYLADHPMNDGLRRPQ